MRVAQAEHGREADALVAAQAGRELRRERGAELGVVEAPREAERVGVGAVELEVDLDRARRDAGGLEVVGAQRGVEVVQRAGADDAHRLAPAQVALGHRLGHERRRAQHADRGGQQEVLLEAAHVAIAGLRTVGDALGEPRSAGATLSTPMSA